MHFSSGLLKTHAKFPLIPLHKELVIIFFHIVFSHILPQIIFFDLHSKICRWRKLDWLKGDSTIGNAYSQRKAGEAFLHCKWCMTRDVQFFYQLNQQNPPKMQWNRSYQRRSMSTPHMVHNQQPVSPHQVSTGPGWATPARSSLATVCVLKLSWYHAKWKNQIPII